MTIQTSIDGLRLVADRTDAYEGQTPVQWCGKDGIWRDIWNEQAHPVASRVGVFKKGFREALYAVAHWDEYVQKTKDGSLAQFWAKMPRLMLGKVAEALALRKAFPNELSGIYATEEIEAEPKPEPKPEIKRTNTIAPQPASQSVVKQPTLRQLFGQLGVSEDDLVEFLGKPFDACTEENIKTLKSVYTDLESGKLDREDMLEFAKLGKEDK